MTGCLQVGRASMFEQQRIHQQCRDRLAVFDLAAPDHLQRVDVSRRQELDLLAFFGEMRSRRELVTAFIAVLEIVRTESVRLVQTATFGDIVLQKV